MTDEWLKERLDYLRGLKTKTDHQSLLLLLTDKLNKSADDDRKIAALVRAEKAAQRAQKARAEAVKIVNSEKVAERKARDHELYLSAGLLGLAGLVEKASGKPVWSRGEMLGALMELAKVAADDPRRAEWKRTGDARLTESERKKKNEQTQP